MVAQSVVIASEVIGFISFAITLLTLLGVYRDLISTMRNAPTEIPIMLGNLRQELQGERAAFSRRVQQGDEFNVFTGKWKTRGKKHLRTTEVTHLLNATINVLWVEFKSLERPFLIKSGNRAEAVHRGDYWGEQDVEEKAPASPKHQRRLGMEEANVGMDRTTYYRTDFSHRFIWWQSRSKVNSLMDQVQRVQVRRIERDAFETDELVKRCLRLLEGRAGGSEDERGGQGSGSDGGGGRRSGVRRRKSARLASRAGSGKTGNRSRSHSVAPRAEQVRETREFEVVRVREKDDDDERDRARPSAEPSNTGRRRETRSGGGYEYEVVRPGRAHAEVVDDSRQPRSRRDSYVERDRDRSWSRERRTKPDRDRASSRYDD